MSNYKKENVMSYCSFLQPHGKKSQRFINAHVQISKK